MLVFGFNFFLKLRESSYERGSTLWQVGAYDCPTLTYNEARDCTILN